MNTKIRTIIITLIAACSFAATSVAPAAAMYANEHTPPKPTIELVIGPITVCDAKGEHCHTRLPHDVGTPEAQNPA
jgi:hypothetical protein